MMQLKRNQIPALSLMIFILILGSLHTVSAETIYVGNVGQLTNAIAQANSNGGDSTILLEDGTYTLNNMLYVTGSDITVGSQSGIRENVIIQGDKMSSNASASHIFNVTGKNFEVRNVTLQRCGAHIIQIHGENNADYPVVKNCILRDSYEQIIKVSVNENNPSISSDNGIVENCLFEYSAGIGPQYYIGGIDAHGAHNWIVRNNTYKNIISPSVAVAEFAIHFWNHSENNLVERNLIINCDRGIGFGLTQDRGNSGGIIRNNMIYHAAGTGRYADVGIALANSPGTEVYNNTVFMQHDFPWAIEYRFSGTRNVHIVNNLSNKPIMKRDGASGIVENNVTNADISWFEQASSGNLHLASAVDSVVDKGQSISGLSNDFDGDRRPEENGIDIGADEYVVNNPPPQPPKNLRILEE